MKLKTSKITVGRELARVKRKMINNNNNKMNSVAFSSEDIPDCHNIPLKATFALNIVPKKPSGLQY